jgi:hypothetical protein
MCQQLFEAFYHAVCWQMAEFFRLTEPAQVAQDSSPRLIGFQNYGDEVFKGRMIKIGAMVLGFSGLIAPAGSV